jgi:IS30 family transposase
MTLATRPVENINRQWRRRFSHGTELAHVEPEHAEYVANIFNNQR